MTSLKDYKLKPLKKFFRPYFSPHTDSYEIDYIYVGKTNTFNVETQKSEAAARYYFVCININTKYLFMIPLSMGENRSIIRTQNAVFLIKSEIEKMNPEATIKYIRGDADSTFGKIVNKEEDEGFVDLGPKRYRFNTFTEFLKDHGIELYLSNSPYINKCRIVDRVIRTIRDKLGENPKLIYDPRNVEKVVNEYNNTLHSAFNYEFTPREVQMHKDLEEYYIREQMLRLNEVRGMQQENGFFNYKPGYVLLIHVDNSKPIRPQNKKRRVFNKLAVFLDYDHGNVLCQVITSTKQNVFKDPIIIPIYHTKFLAMSTKDIPKHYLQLVF